MPPRTLVKDHFRSPYCSLCRAARRHGRADGPRPRRPGAESTLLRHLNTPAGERDPDLLPEGQRAAIARRPGSRASGRRHLCQRFPTDPADRGAARRAAGLTPIVYDPADTPAWSPGSAPARCRRWSSATATPCRRSSLSSAATRPAPLVHADFGDIWRIGPGGGPKGGASRALTEGHRTFDRHSRAG